MILLETVLASLETMFLHIYEVGVEIALRNQDENYNLQSPDSKSQGSSTSDFSHDLLHLFAFAGIRFGGLLATAGVGSEHEQLLSSKKKQAVNTANMYQNSSFAHSRASESPKQDNVFNTPDQQSDSGLSAFRLQKGYFNPNTATDITSVLSAFSNGDTAAITSDFLKKYTTILHTNNPSNTDNSQSPSNTTNNPSSADSIFKSTLENPTQISALNDPTQLNKSSPPQPFLSSNAPATADPGMYSGSQPNNSPWEAVPPSVVPSANSSTASAINATFHTPTNFSAPAWDGADQNLNTTHTASGNPKNSSLFPSRSENPSAAMDQIRQLDISTVQQLQSEALNSTVSLRDIRNFWHSVAAKNGHPKPPLILNYLDVSYSIPSSKKDVSLLQPENAENSLLDQNVSQNFPAPTNVSDIPVSSTSTTDFFKSLNSVRGRQNVLTQDIKVFNNISSQSVAPPTFSPSNNLNHPNVDRPCPLGLVSPTPTFNSNDSPDSYNKSPGSSYSSQSPSTSYGLQSKSDNQGVSGRESVCRDGALVTGSASLESVVANPDNSGFIDNSQMLVFQGNGPSFSDGIHTDNPMDLKLAPRQDCAQMFGDNNVYNLQGIKTEPTNQITWGLYQQQPQFQLQSFRDPSQQQRHQQVMIQPGASMPVVNPSFSIPNSLPDISFLDTIKMGLDAKSSPFIANDFDAHVNDGNMRTLEQAKAQARKHLADLVPTFRAMSSPPSTCTSASKFFSYSKSPYSYIERNDLVEIAQMYLDSCQGDYFNSRMSAFQHPVSPIYSEFSERFFRHTLLSVLKFFVRNETTELTRFFLGDYTENQQFFITRIIIGLKMGISIKKTRWTGKVENDDQYPGFWGPVKIEEYYLGEKQKVEQILNKDNKDGNNIVIEVDEELLIDNLTKMTMCLGTIPRVRVASVCKEVESVLNPFYAV